MTRELDNLLAAAKAIWLGCGETEVGNLHRAITEFEAARDMDAIRFSGGTFNAGTILENPENTPDPYDFENAGLRKEP